MTLIDIYYKYCLYCSFTPPLENIRKLVLWVRGCLEQYPAIICSIPVSSTLGICGDRQEIAVKGKTWLEKVQ